MPEKHQILRAVITVLLLGVGAQWVAWILRIPSILVLLTAGLAAGALGWLDPETQFGHGVEPFVAVAVALILYEGGLSLRFRELHGNTAVVWRLVTLGAGVTWVVSALAAAIFLDLGRAQALGLGAILVVTGPTVVGPLLRHIRPSGAVGPVLKWEGIVIDPIGAMLAVLVFEVISPSHTFLSVVKTVFLGGGLGIAGGMSLAVLLRRHWIPGYLDNAMSLMVVGLVYGLSEMLQPESGLMAATVMGMTLANQKLADIEHIVEFKEHLQILLISSLFVILASQVDVNELANVGWGALGFIAVLFLVARPLSVLVATVGSALSVPERLFMAWVAPRGIVAAAVASVLAGEALVAITFMVILATVVVYGLTGPLVAQWLGVAERNPQGVLMVGADAWARAVAEALKKHGFRVLLVDTNRQHVAAARLAGLETHTDSILAEHIVDDLELGGLGRLVATTSNDWVNALATQRFVRVFGRSEVYQLRPLEGDDDSHRHLHGRWLFAEGTTWGHLARRMREGAVVKSTQITEAFTWDSYREHYGDRAVPMFIITDTGKLQVLTETRPADPQPGQTLISLLVPSEDAP